MKPPLLRTVFCLGVSLLTLPAFAADASAPAAELPHASTTEHSREHETEAIRKHHIKRLNDRMTVEAHELHATCRYESEISTHPPARQVVLTFDDGPEPNQTEFILDTLKKHGISSATFFLIGKKAQQHPELVAKISASGHHIIGNHSWDHPNFHDIGVSNQAEEVQKTEALFANQPKPKFFRYPYGNSSCETNELLHKHEYQIVGWHIDSCDWAYDHNGSIDAKEALSCGVLPQNTKDFVEHVVSSVRAHNGGIVLLHEIHPNTLHQLDAIITRLKSEGFSFASMTAPEFSASLR